MTNILQKYEEFHNYHLIKVSNPLFIYQIYDPCLDKDFPLTYHLPYLLRFNEKSKMHINGSTILINIDYPYFHNVLENFSIILNAYEKDNDVTVILNSNQCKINKKNNDFIGMNNEVLYDNDKNRIHNISYIKNFLLYFNIKYICIDSNEIKSISSDESFLGFYITNLVDVRLKRGTPPESIYATANEYGNQVYWTQITPNFVDYDTMKSLCKIIYRNLPNINTIKNKKIYISRAKTPGRNLNIEEDIENYFKKNNFEIIYLEEYSFIDQIKIIKQSEYIVTRHGAGLINVIFANKYSKIVELHFSELDKPYTSPLPYKNLVINNLHYNSLIINGTDKDDILNNLDIQYNYLNNQIIKGAEYFDAFYQKNEGFIYE